MSKQLILLRHAEALPSLFGENDFDRPLSENGIKETKNLMQFFIGKGIKPELIIASSAKRTTQTAKIVASSLALNEENIILEKSLYNSTAKKIENVINTSQINKNIQTLLLIAHNPSISELASELLSQPTVIHLPPCGMMIFSVKIDNWTDYLFNKTELLFKKFPNI